MSVIRKATLALPSDLLSEIDAAIAAGEFPNTSEAVSEAIRCWKLARTGTDWTDDELRALIAEGRESGSPLDGEEVFAELRARYAAMAAEHKR